MSDSPLLLLFREPVAFVAVVVGLLVAVTVHELGHAVSASAEGDGTPRANGRLSLNPLRHLDPFGTIVMVLAGYGWGRPVPFQAGLLRHRRLGAVVVILAGPLVNLAFALASAVALKVIVGADTVNQVTFTFAETFLRVNLILAIVNCIPIPPLDGARLLAELLPPAKRGVVDFLEQYGIYLLLALVLLPLMSQSLDWLTPLVQRAETGVLLLVGVI